jgi:hypothetical protein
MAIKNLDRVFRDLHDNVTEWTCGYCQQVAITIRHGVAVCPRHKDLWTVGLQPPVKVEASANH